MPPSAYSRLPSHNATTSAFELQQWNEPYHQDSAAESLQSSKAKGGLGQDAEVPERSRFKKRFSGWRFGFAVFAILMVSVLIINVIFTIWATSTYKPRAGIGTMRAGSCKRIEIANTWLHLAINVLGTVMLSGSNYCAASPMVQYTKLTPEKACSAYVRQHETK